MIPNPLSSQMNTLGQDALAEILKRGAPILGFDDGCSKSSKTCDWMAKIPIIPSWPPTRCPELRCQENSIFQSLNAGIRVFDLRYAYNPGNLTIGFHHGTPCSITTIEDVFFGLYTWLDKHPTEAVLVSLNHESGTGTPNDEALQQHLYDVFNSSPATRYWLQTSGTLGTLGEARGKLTLLQRFDYDLLPASSNKRIGIHLDAAHWTDNSPSITLVYNSLLNQTAFIEDNYEPNVPLNSGPVPNIQAKFNVTTAHLEEATTQNPDQLYISFASAERTLGTPPVFPKTMALGDGTNAVPGVNQKLLPWLQARKGKRFGIIMLDFYDALPELVEAVIGL
ncbi:PLC-like phosphodiesterase [Infundibulicybe gibba]|nr:PLC-like phosphodiesterase [Infundibulicybe gibba]